MINKSLIKRFLTLNVAIAGVIILGGQFTEVNGQGRDPFQKPGWAIQRDAKRPTTSSAAKKPTVPVVPPIPSIDQRIEFFKRLRQQAVMNDQPLPKVTSVLTLNEMVVTGISRTPKGYAAIVEAVPIKLSYTIYPGEKFFDGQLVAVDENQLVFRRVTKTDKNKFVTSVEHKPLRQYSAQAEIQGAAPVQEGAPPETVATYQAPAPNNPAPAVTPVPALMVSPLDEMNNQKPEPDTAKKAPAKKAKRPVRVARKN